MKKLLLTIAAAVDFISRRAHRPATGGIPLMAGRSPHTITPGGFCNFGPLDLSIDHGVGPVDCLGRRGRTIPDVARSSAWLQTLPEFAVEGVIAWEAGKDPEKIHLVTANFTGSLRLLVGLGWPMIFATAAFFTRRRRGGVLGHIELDEEHAVEVIGLAPPILYFVFIWWKGNLTIFDSIVLTGLYLAYLYILNKIPPRSDENIEDMERIPRAILSLPTRQRNATIAGLFAGGGMILYFAAHPFLDSMLALAVELSPHRWL